MWHQNELESGLSSWFWVSVGPTCKTRQRLNWQFIDYLEKRDFLQMTPNISILYTVENNFSPWVWIRDHYLKIRFHLAQSIGKVLPFYTVKYASDSDTFIANRGYLCDDGSVLSIVVPRLATKIDRRLPFFTGVVAAITRVPLWANVGVHVAGKLQSTISSRSECG